LRGAGLRHVFRPRAGSRTREQIADRLFFRDQKQIVDHLYKTVIAGLLSLRGGPSEVQCGALASLRKVHDRFGIEPGPIIPGDLRYEGGLAAGSAVTKLSPRPTAVMAINGSYRRGILKALLKAGVRVPQDISVTGFETPGSRNTAILDHHRRCTPHMLGRWRPMRCITVGVPESSSRDIKSLRADFSETRPALPPSE